MSKYEIRHWKVTQYKGDWMPAFVADGDGAEEVRLIVYAEDFCGMTKSDARMRAVTRNRLQIENAEAEVARLERELHAARNHFDKVRTSLAPFCMPF